MTLTGAAPAPTVIVFGTDGWRARIADEFTYDNVRRCADGVAAYVTERGEAAKGVVIAYDRRFSSEYFAMAAAEVLLAHDIGGRLRGPRRPDPDVLVRGRRARSGGRDRHHRQPQPVGRQRVQGQGADRRRGRRRHPVGHRGAARGQRRDRPSRGGRSPTPRRPGWSSGSTRSTATSGSSAGRSTSMRSRRADMSVLVDPMWGAGSGWMSRLLAGGRIRVNEIHQERNPYFGGVNPEPIRPNIDEALAMLAGGGYDLGLLPRRRCRPRRRRRRARDLRPPARGHRAADVLPRRAPRLARPGRGQRQQHLDGRAAGRALRHRDPRDAGRLQVHRAEDDRDRGDARRRGVGRFRVRDAPPRARRRLRRPDARSTCSCASGRPGAGRCRARSSTSTRSPDRRSTCAPTSTSSGPSYPETKRRLLVDLAAAAPTDARRRAGRPDRAARHRRRLQVLPGRRVVAARSGPRARSRWSGSTRRPARPGFATRCWWPASGWSAADDRRAAAGARGGSTSRGATS